MLDIVWADMNTALMLAPGHDGVATAFAACISNGMRADSQAANELLPRVTELLCAAFRRQPHHAHLDLAASLVSRHGRSAAHAGRLLGMYMALAEKTMSLFQLNAHIEQPDVIGSFFALTAATYRPLGAVLCSTEDSAGAERIAQTRTILQWATAALDLPELPTVKAACDALGVMLDVLSQAGAGAASAVLEQNGAGHNLMAALLSGIGGSAARASVRELGGVLWRFKSCFGEAATGYAERTLGQPGFPSSRVSLEAKSSFWQVRCFLVVGGRGEGEREGRGVRGTCSMPQTPQHREAFLIDHCALYSDCWRSGARSATASCWWRRLRQPVAACRCRRGGETWARAGAEGSHIESERPPFESRLWRRAQRRSRQPTRSRACHHGIALD